MSTTLGGDEENPYPPPQLAPSSPQIPRGTRLPIRSDRAFVDTSAIFGEDWRLPLLLLAGSGLLEICWSPYVAAEVARVATREQALETVASGGASARDRMTTDLETRRHEIDRVIADHERRWRAPDPEALADVYEAHTRFPVGDAHDHPVLAAAIAVRASYLLTANTTDFRHGGSYAGVTFWHPDTFLTAYFSGDLEAYVFVRDEYERFASAAGAKLRP